MARLSGEQRRIVAHTGVIHAHVDSTEARFGHLEHRLDLVFLSNVTPDANYFPAAGARG